ncbi:MAG TPA: hypothetical protein VMH80_05665 [Bryobacteraceae bacterium]|nr:hypothetical protein [Bryobacteraceae bacterium]
MIALILCFVAFFATFRAGKRSLAFGIIGVFTVGYFYGIIRANLPTAASHFIFDAALLGLYLSQNWMRFWRSQRSGALHAWMLVLMIWPCLLLLMPFQPLLVSLVGLRGAILFLPMAVLGSRLRGEDLETLSVGFAILNLAALGFATAEYFLGVPRFYPFNAATIIIYLSSDVAGGFYRIPATFINAHAFGSMMVGTLPFLLGAWSVAERRIVRLLAVVGTGAALLGILMSATRLNFVLGATLVLVAIWTGRMSSSRRLMFAGLIAVMLAIAFGNARFQRFKSLSDTSYVEDRISGSVNRDFFEILFEYPMGNGLGGGGTSIPYFLQGEVRNPIAMENEYARILGEQGVIGLLLWIGFIAWFLGRAKASLSKGPWATTRRLIWGGDIVGLVTATLGTGMLTAIPGTAVFLLGMGIIAVRPRLLGEVTDSNRRRVGPAVAPQQRYRPTVTA